MKKLIEFRREKKRTMGEKKKGILKWRKRKNKLKEKKNKHKKGQYINLLH
jgi:hypothetical protein